MNAGTGNSTGILIGILGMEGENSVKSSKVHVLLFSQVKCLIFV